MAAAVQAGKYYRVLRANDSQYRAPGLIRRDQDEDGGCNNLPLYFTNDIGMLQFAYHWGTTFCEVEIPEGVSVELEEDSPERPVYSAPCIRLGKVQKLTGSVISNILLAAQRQKLISFSLLRDIMETWGMGLYTHWGMDSQLRVLVTVPSEQKWNEWIDSTACPYYSRTIQQQYEHDKSTHERHISTGQAEPDDVFPPFTRPSKFHRKTAYRVTLKDVAEIAGTIQKMLVVGLAP